MPDFPYPTWIEVDLEAVAHNTRLTAEWTRAALMVVVKDNAYGHGALEVSRVVLREGASQLAVARCQEGIDLRRAGIDAPVLVLGGTAPGEIDAALAHNLTLPLHGFAAAELIAARAQAAGRAARVHLKIDTGMGRFGVFPHEAAALARRAVELGGIEIDGIFSHFPSAGEDPAFTAAQLERFKAALAAVRGAGIQPNWVHLANTAGIIHEPGSFFNLVRAGGVIYAQGIGPSPAPFTSRLRRTFTWKAQLVSVRKLPPGYGIGYGQTYHTSGEEWIGVVPVGYGDGYQRAPGTSVLVGGQRAPVVGRVCMDQLMVRLPHEFPIGSEVVLVGSQGGELIAQEEIQHIWKSSFSTVTLAQPRVPRIYLRG